MSEDPPLNINAFKAGHFRQQIGFKAFFPERINRPWTWEDPAIGTLLEQANHALGRLDGYSRIVPNVGLFLGMFGAKEATQSSRIEGTQTKVEEAVLPREQIAPERRDDWQEVQNYIQAMQGALEDLKSLPLSNRLLRQAHGRLLSGVRGERKDPGEFRRSQNWIGGSNPGNAAFVPPPFEEVGPLMGDLEAFWHNDRIQVPHLVRIAISHYQFETIHPFLDGNGRIGRLLIALYLVDKKLLATPTLYLSDFFERHRGAYYDALTGVRSQDDLGHWVRFFLTAVVETADRSCRTFDALLQLQQQCQAQVADLGRRAGNGQKLLVHLYAHPFVTVADIAQALKITPKSAGELAEGFVELGIFLKPTAIRNRNFIFGRYLDIFEAHVRGEGPISGK